MTCRSCSILTLLVLAPLISAQAQAGHDHAAMHHGSDSGYAAMKARGTMAMGVDQDQSTHHFTSLPDGGRIELTSDVDDSAATAAIRKHFADIERAFAAGDFSTPMAVHAQDVPGTAVMKAKAAAISYTMREVPRGAELRIVTHDKAAITAVHQFLHFQRTEHHAGQ